MNIAGIQKTTLVDFPGKVATTIFTLGCNMRCPYCHNKQIAFDFDSEHDLINEKDLYKILKERNGFIDGLVISGGEPTLQKNLIPFMKKVKKDLGLLIKLDTNGSNPEILKKIIDLNLVDYIALDIKTSFENYKRFLGVDGSKILESYNLIKDSDIDYELRMTCFPDFINNNNISEIMPYLSSKDKIFIQKCLYNSENVENTYEKDQLALFNTMFIAEGFESTKLRGM